MKQTYGSTITSRVDCPLFPALTNNSIIIILKNTHTSKLQAGIKQRYLLGEHTRQSDDQTRYQSDTNSFSCIPRVHCYLLRTRDRLHALHYRLSNLLSLQLVHVRQSTLSVLQEQSEKRVLRQCAVSSMVTR